MPIQGLRSTSDALASGRPESWREGILLLEPNGDAPLYALSSLMDEESVDDPHFHWFEELEENFRLQISASYLIGATTISVTEGALHLKAGDILMIEGTGEQMLVTADPSSDTSITVSRGFAGTTAAAYDPTAAGNNPYALLMGSAYEEGSLAPTGRTYEPTERSNYCQIFRDTMEITRTARATRYRTGDAVKHDKRRTLSRHSVGIERSILYGKKSLAVVNGNPRRTMDGILQQIPVNLDFSPANGDLSMALFESYMMEVFRYGGSEKLCLTGNKALMAFNQMARKNSSYQFEQGQKEYGMDVRRFITAFGVLVLKTHPMLNRLPGGTTAGTAYTGQDSLAIVLDMKNLKYVYLEGGDTQWQQKLEDNGRDGDQAGYLTECSMKLMQPETHAVIRGLDAGIVDA